MLRSRHISSLHRNKIKAAEYFGEIMQKMRNLKDVIEQQEEEPIILDRDYNAMTRTNLLVDFVLVYDKHSKPIAKEKVNTFLKNLVHDGMSTEGYESEVYPDLIFIKIHCPRNKLINAGTVFDMGLSFLSSRDLVSEYHIYCNFEFLFNDLTSPSELSDLAQRGIPDSVFNLKPKDITTAERIMVVYELLKQTRFGEGEDEFGILGLLKKKYLHTCFPLHDGDYKWSDEGRLNDRQVLMKYWASNTNLFKLQPLDLVKKYFGPEVGYYFAFIGYFNKMLMVPAAFGLIGILYGFLTCNDKRNIQSHEICESDLIICPSCYEAEICKYQTLKEECSTSKLSYILDNIVTEMYSIFWCLWSTIVYSRWKQYESVLKYKWDLVDLEGEVNIRHEYLVRVFKNKKRPVTNIYQFADHQCEESWYQKILRFCSTGILFFIVVLLILAVLYLEMTIRIYVGYALGRFEGQLSLNTASLCIATIGNLFILLYVCIAEDVYVFVALVVTDLDNHPTQEAYELAYIYKYASLCIVTSYSFLCYNAFLKGIFSTYPGDEVQYKLFGFFQYDMDKVHTSHLSTLYLWTFLTVGKEIWRAFRNIQRPIFTRIWLRKPLIKGYQKKKMTGWDRDYALPSRGNFFHWDRTMNIVLQYGYLVLFAGAQPLGPFMFFCYNIFLIRRDARYLLSGRRRGVPIRTTGLGPWLEIIKMLTFMGMGSNVFYLAFSTNFVLKISQWFNPYYSKSFINFTFSEFAVDDYPSQFGSEIKKGYEGKTCFYKGNRHGPTAGEMKYQIRIEHWNKMSLRFLTVLIVQSMVIIFGALIYCYFGRVPHYIRERIKHRLNIKRKEREDRLRRDRGVRSTARNDIRDSFKVLDF